MNKRQLQTISKIEKFIAAADSFKEDGSKKELTGKEIIALRESAGCTIPGVIWKLDTQCPTGQHSVKTFILTEVLRRYKASLGSTPKVETAPVVESVPVVEPTPVVTKPSKVLEMPILNDELRPADYIPMKNPTYIKWGNHSHLKTVINSNQFFPVLITGQSGTGKTEMVEQLCCDAKRALIKVSITDESDETKLIGGMFLIDGNTIWKDGPVLKAMKLGAVLLLDEVDLGGYNIMCLQSILEGKPYLNKKTGEIVPPTPGFTIICTANTKGEGNTTGRYVGTQVLNAAFLDRINITLNQEYPPASIEKRILTANAVRILGSKDRITEDDEMFFNGLVLWGKQIRKAYEINTVSDVISTRRLCTALKTFFMFNRNDEFAIESITNRYDEDDKEAFSALWTASREHRNVNSDDDLDNIE